MLGWDLLCFLDLVCLDFFSRPHLESRIRLVSAHPLREAVQDLGGDGEAEGRNEVQRGGRHLQRGQSQAIALFYLSPKMFHS